MRQVKNQLHKLECQECKKEQDDFALIRMGESKRVGRFIKIAVCWDCLDQMHYCTECGDQFFRNFLPPYDSHPYCSEECSEEAME